MAAGATSRPQRSRPATTPRSGPVACLAAIALAGEDAGFTIIEMVVAIAAGLLIMFATFTVISASMTVQSRVTDRVQATQQSRVAMERLVQELNSGCLASDVSPVQPSSAAVAVSPVVNSDGSHIVFVSGVGDGATATPTEHVVSYNSQTDTLTDTSYRGTGGSPASLTAASTWTFSATPAATWQLANVLPVGTTPLFQYFTFGQATYSLVGAAPIASLPLNATWPAPATETNAAYSVAQVNISWQVGPSSGSTETSRRTTMQDSVVFRVTPPSSSSANYPCD